MKTIFSRQNVVLGFAFTTLMLTGCATSTRYERTSGEFMDDKRLIGRVKHALDAQPVYKYPDVKVQTYRGVVQLSGFVATEAQREAATEIAQLARGVGRVENNILIAPLDENALRDYIPGRTTARSTNATTQSAGSPSANSATSSGAGQQNGQNSETDKAPQ